MLLKICLAISWLWAQIPLPILSPFGVLIGKLHRYRKTRIYRAAKINIDHCLSDADEQTKTKLLASHMIEYCREMLFAPAMLRRSTGNLQKLFVAIKGSTALTTAIADPRPVVLINAHMGAMLLGGSLKQFKATWFSQNQGGIFEPILDHRRKTLEVDYVYTDPRGVRQAFHQLKQGGTVGIFCDHDPGQQGRELLTFFGKPIYTATLPAKIIQRSCAQAFFYLSIRDTSLPWWQIGYNLYIIPADSGVYDSDAKTASQAINDQLEAIIRCHPLHFAWSYERFRRVNREMYRSIKKVRKKKKNNRQ